VARVAAQVEHHAAALGGHRPQSRPQLPAAVAAQRTEHVAGQALGVDTDQHILAVAEVAADEGDVFALVVAAGVADRGELAGGERDARRGHPLDQLLEPATVGDQAGDGDHRQAVLSREPAQLLWAGHLGGVLLADDLAQRAGRSEPGQSGEIHGRLGVPGPAQHAAVPCPQRDDMARPGEVCGAGAGRGQQRDGARAVGGRDAGADPLAGVDRHRERGAAAVLVGVVHGRQPKTVRVRLGQGYADVARAVPHGEREQLGGRVLGGEDEVSLVLPVRVVDDDHRLAGGDVRDRLFDRVERERGRARGHRCHRERPSSVDSPYAAGTGELSRLPMIQPRPIAASRPLPEL
jgi:hypothetical protein